VKVLNVCNAVFEYGSEAEFFDVDTTIDLWTFAPLSVRHQEVSPPGSSVLTEQETLNTSGPGGETCSYRRHNSAVLSSVGLYKCSFCLFYLPFLLIVRLLCFYLMWLWLIN